MDIGKIYNDPIVGQKRKGTLDDPYLEYNETLTIVNGRAQLTETPNRFHRVKVSGDNHYWYETEDGDLKDNLFRVDYTHGIVFFNANQNNKSLIFTYTGEGNAYFPASRVWTKQSNGEVERTIQEMIDEGELTITEGKTATADAQTATQDALNAAGTANQRLSDYETTVNNAKKIYKPMVSTYAEIATLYPSPSTGWTTSVEDTGMEYRWDGIEWVNTGFADTGGFNVFVGITPPENVNTIWLEDSVTTPYLTKVIPSAEPPSDTTKIWLDTDE